MQLSKSHKLFITAFLLLLLPLTVLTALQATDTRKQAKLLQNRPLPRRPRVVAQQAPLCYQPALPTTTNQWRFGVGHGRTREVNFTDYVGYNPDLPDNEFNPLNLGWYFNWSPGDNYGGRVGEIEFMPLVSGYAASVGKVTPSLEEMQRIYADYPSNTTFLFGNEVGFPPPQDDGRSHVQYAEDYHATYYAIKEVGRRLGKNFYVATGATVPQSPWYPNYPNGFTECDHTHGTEREEATCMSGLEYFEAMRQHYVTTYNESLPVDVFRINGYTIGNVPWLRRVLEDTRSYMAENGWRNRPLIISEIGWINSIPTEEQVQNYLQEAYTELITARDPELGYQCDDNRLVQRFAWFIFNDVPDAPPPFYATWEETALYSTQTRQLKPLGEKMREVTEELLIPPLTPTPSLRPTSTPTPTLNPTLTPTPTITPTPTPCWLRPNGECLFEGGNAKWSGTGENSPWTTSGRVTLFASNNCTAGEDNEYVVGYAGDGPAGGACSTDGTGHCYAFWEHEGGGHPFNSRSYDHHEPEPSCRSGYGAWGIWKNSYELKWKNW